ncbi:MAG: NADH-quinone oxidoreductase subunit M [Anaerolineae bacterium]|nr:MAG: NADH-quinone oxidoreductase subunit M [Anaerolineae bacterium]MCL4876927.1 NADH-quinone oxidoreductase subunit M [Anaerolineae bacterium]
MESGILTGIVAVPSFAALIILFLKKDQKQEARVIAAAATLVSLLLSAFVFFSYNVDEANAVNAANRTDAQGDLYFAFEDDITWIEELGISYHVGVDGVSAAMILLTGLASFAGVLISWRIDDRPREFMAFFLLLVVGVYGVFVSVDMFLLFFFYELAIFPMYFLIAGWGWVELREYAAMKLTLYILVGSIVALVGFLAMYFQAAEVNGFYSFDFQDLYHAAKSGAFDDPGYLGIDGLTLARFWFPSVFIGMAVLAGLFPFHNWSPDGHVAAPTAVSMIHAGVLMKLGAFAAMRLGIQLLPDGARVHLPWIVFLALTNIVWGAFIAFRQRDFKYVIGFSSVSHMGLVSLGMATMNITGLTGAGLQMFSHGVMTALFFTCVGLVYEQAHTRDLPSLGGFIYKMPLVGLAFILGGLVSMGMPGLSGFIAEFPILIGVWRGVPEGVAAATQGDVPYLLQNAISTSSNGSYYTYIVIFAVLGIILTAAYVLRVVGQVFFGEFNEERFPGVKDISVLDRIAILSLMVWLVLLGIFPSMMSDVIESGMQPVVDLLSTRFGG